MKLNQSMRVSVTLLIDEHTDIRTRKSAVLRHDDFHVLHRHMGWLAASVPCSGWNPRHSPVLSHLAHWRWNEYRVTELARRNKRKSRKTYVYRSRKCSRTATAAAGKRTIRANGEIEADIRRIISIIIATSTARGGVTWYKVRRRMTVCVQL